jgi:hypothetical protein
MFRLTNFFFLSSLLFKKNWDENTPKKGEGDNTQVFIPIIVVIAAICPDTLHPVGGSMSVPSNQTPVSRNFIYRDFARSFRYLREILIDAIFDQLRNCFACLGVQF